MHLVLIDTKKDLAAREWVEFLPLGSDLQNSVLFSSAEPRVRHPYAATQLALKWPLNALNAGAELQNPKVWTYDKYTHDQMAQGISKRTLLSGLSETDFVENGRLLNTLSNTANAFLPNVYKKKELVHSIASAALAFMNVINTRDMIVILSARPSREIKFQQPQERGVQAAFSVTPAGFLVADPTLIKAPDAASIAVGNLPPYRSEIFSRNAERVRGGILIAFNDLTKSAPVAYLAPAVSEGISVHVHFYAVPGSGPKRQTAPTLLQRTMDRFRTGPC